ncbi:hypothetical protein IFM89_023310 [Coptis chinensis]|uniref:Uncharacterized protein n=1 Tax=Coptis chinensis TaxID=261450 RepID=A0A835LJ97_9MAGN|nr:hypothetical protein IFM89_023310 [Coptis chinensis]
MGNCIRHESSAVWAGEDWSSVISKEPAAKDKLRNKMKKNQRSATTLAGDKRIVRSSTEIKVRITKKELEELLQKVDDVEGLSVEQALSQFMNSRHQYDIQERSSSQLSLQSIPEVDEADNQRRE